MKDVRRKPKASLIKTFIIFLVVISVVVAIAIFSANNSSKQVDYIPVEPNNIISDWKTYSANSISIDYPPNINVTSADKISDFVGRWTSKEETLFSVESLGLIQMSISKRNTQQNYKTVQFHTLSNIKADHYLAEGTGKKGNYKLELHIFLKDEIVLTCSSVPAFCQSDIFNQILSKLKVS
jgi:hypothetical protein